MEKEDEDEDNEEDKEDDEEDKDEDEEDNDDSLRSLALQKAACRTVRTPKQDCGEAPGKRSKISFQQPQEVTSEVDPPAPAKPSEDHGPRPHLDPETESSS